MTCLGCNALHGPAQILCDGRKVCTACPAWRDECLAREMLTWRLAARREWLAQQTPARREEMQAILTAVHSKREAA